MEAEVFNYVNKPSYHVIVTKEYIVPRIEYSGKIATVIQDMLPYEQISWAQRMLHERNLRKRTPNRQID